MADTFTTNLNLTKPEVGASSDTWGNKTNANWDSVDALFPSGILGLANGGTGAANATGARTNLGLGALATLSTLTENLITDGSILARVGSAETITGAWNFTTAPTVPASTVTAHQSSLSITESQIADGTLLARTSGNETVTGNWTVTGTWTFSIVPSKSGGGRLLHYASATNTGGSVTLSTSAPSGTPAAGDVWIRHAA